jgi:2-polyprenyl-6-hydroxyphenyl methylase/3-demethylubiquinone-9 3-methyltransferase
MSNTVSPAEVQKFERLAAEWWSADGQFRPLHKLNPLRLGYVRDRAAAHFGRDIRRPRPLAGLRLLDVGCGGGLLCEPLTRLGAEVTGIDPSQTNIGVARRHAETSGLAVDYRATTAEALAAAGETFDVVLAMEVVEHVADRDAFVAACGALLKPGGLLVLATINRTPKAYALVILGAERVLRWLPRGTHRYEMLVRPAELEAAQQAAGLAVLDRTGVTYDLLADRFRLCDDLGANYMMASAKPAPAAASP